MDVVELCFLSETVLYVRRLIQGIWESGRPEVSGITPASRDNSDLRVATVMGQVIHNSETRENSNPRGSPAAAAL